MDRIREITKLQPYQLKELPIHEKVIWLRSTLDKNTPTVHEGSNTITVNRDTLVQDALGQFKAMEDPRKVLQVTFLNEVSQDLGGLSREFFTTMMKELLSDGLGLFAVANTEEFSYKIAEDSFEIQGADELYHFFG